MAELERCLSDHDTKTSVASEQFDLQTIMTTLWKGETHKHNGGNRYRFQDIYGSIKEVLYLPKKGVQSYEITSKKSVQSCHQGKGWLLEESQI